MFVLKPLHRAIWIAVFAGVAMSVLVWVARNDPVINFLPRDSRAEWIVFPAAVDTHAHWFASLDATFQPWRSGPWSHLFFEGRIDYTSPSKSIETTSFGIGIGYRGRSDIHDPDAQVAQESAANEIVASYWKTVTNSFNSASHTARAEAIDYRRRIWKELSVSVGFLNEGDTRLIRRNGITAEGWLEPTFNSGLWSIGAGFGFYTALDKYRPSSGRHVSDIVSLTLSLRPTRNFDVRLLWHRIVTDYNRDADILLLGLGYRF